MIVTGDLNDEPKSDPLKPLIATPDLIDVLDTANIPVNERWTYYYGVKKQFNTIDYMFVSKPLSKLVKAAGLERRGMWNLEKLTNGAQKPFPTVTGWKLSASDHAAVWADFDL